KRPHGLTYLNFDPWLEINKEIDSKSDRVTAIVLSAITQDSLVDVIRASMAKRDYEVPWLTDPAGPLGRFKAQILLAYAVGIIGKNAATDLDCIRQIRNKFAHWPLVKHCSGKWESPTFSSPEIREFAMSLKCPSAAVDIKGDGVKSPITDPRERF